MKIKRKSPHNRPIIKLFTAILNVLENESPVTTIERKTGLNNRSIYRHYFPVLFKAGIIKFRVDRTNKNIKVRLYSLTEKGIQLKTLLNKVTFLMYEEELAVLQCS